MTDTQSVSESKFYMVRCLIAMAHADGEVCDEERAYMHALMSRLPLSQEQEAALENDLEHAQPIEDLLPHVKDPKYRGQLPYFARLMAQKDGEFHPSEQELMGILHAYSTSGLDMDALSQEAHRAAEHKLANPEDSAMEDRAHGGLFGTFDKILLSMGVDLMRD